MKIPQVLRWFAVLMVLTFQSHMAQAQGILFFPRADGSVWGVDVGTSNVVKQISATAFVQGANPGAGRTIGFDPVTRLMWYSATDGQIHSVQIDSLVAGPSITGIPGANPGSGRHLFLDYKRRTLWTSQPDGSVAIYSLATQLAVGTVPIGFFLDGNVGALRHFASDERSGMMWYAATDGTFIEMNPDTVTRTGRVIPFSQQTGANPGSGRHFVVDPLRDLLLYSVSDGSVASVNLTTLTAASLTISGGAFEGGSASAGRTITYDIQPIALAPSSSTGGLFSFSWKSLGTNYAYALFYRTNLSSGAWALVPPTNQWPSTQTSLGGISFSLPAAYYRLSIQTRTN
ncbi:MAG TPA: hypothetical protein VK846_07330 [Candidatus Limnocylindria bacterium]|nr:hypothetical protein [Candidatus Limnocylindria bacterium]